MGRSPDAEADRLVRPRPGAKVVAFYSFGEALYGGPYYDTQSLENVLKPDASWLGDEWGPPTRLYGAPPRLRVENQLGYKMVKWIERIEFVESEKQMGKGKAEKTKMTNILIYCRTSEGLTTDWTSLHF